MSFGHHKLYPFPAVQYIPLPVTTIARGPVPEANPKLKRPQLLPGLKSNPSWDAIQPDLSARFANLNDPDCYPIMALNLEIEDIKYRGFYLTMTGRPVPGFYQFCTIPKHYFYKKNLFFELYDGATAANLATASVLLS